MSSDAGGLSNTIAHLSPFTFHLSLPAMKISSTEPRVNFPVGNLGKSPVLRSLGPGSLLQHHFPFQDLAGLGTRANLACCGMSEMWF